MHAPPLPWLERSLRLILVHQPAHPLTRLTDSRPLLELATLSTTTGHAREGGDLLR